MANYLRFDGVKDHLITPTITFNKIELDIEVENTVGKAQTYFDARSTNLLAYLSRNVNNLEIWLTVVLSVTINGVLKLPSNNVIPNKQRTLVTVNLLLPAKDSVTIFAKKDKTEHVKGKLYRARFFQGSTVVADYNMQARTLQDQSGNSNHATAEGGTWATDTPNIIDSGEMIGTSESNGLAEANRIRSGTGFGTSETSGSTTAQRIVCGQVEGVGQGTSLVSANKVINGETSGNAESTSTLKENKLISGEALGFSETNGVAILSRVKNAESFGIAESNGLAKSSKLLNGAILGTVETNGRVAATLIASGIMSGRTESEAIAIASRNVSGELIGKTITSAYVVANKSILGETMGSAAGMAIAEGMNRSDLYHSIIKGELFIIRKQSNKWGEESMEMIVLGSNGVIMEQTIMDLEPKVMEELGEIDISQTVITVSIAYGPNPVIKPGKLINKNTIQFKISSADIPKPGMYTYTVWLNFPNGDTFPCFEKMLQVVT